MKVPQHIQKLFERLDHLNKNGIIDAEEIIPSENDNSIFNTNSELKLYKIEEGMTLDDFIYKNMDAFRECIQLTDNNYEEKREVKKRGKLIPTNKHRKKTKDYSNSLEIFQGQYAVKKYSEQTPYLQTFYVCNCVALTIYDKASKKGFIAHIDTAQKAKSLKDLPVLKEFNPETSEARIIGGLTDFSEGTIEIIDGILNEKNLNIVERDVLGYDEERAIQLNLKTGEVSDYTEDIPIDDRNIEDISMDIGNSPLSKNNYSD